MRGLFYVLDARYFARGMDVEDVQKFLVLSP